MAQVSYLRHYLFDQINRKGDKTVLDPKQQATIEQLYKEMYPKLFIYASATLHSQQQAEEAVQDTFRIACAKIHALTESENPQGWLMNTLKYVIANMRRSLAKLNNALCDSIPEDRLSSPYDQDFVTELVYASMLNEEDFKLLKMVVLQNFTILDASKVLGLPLETCKKRLQRIKKKLAKKIEK